MWKLHLSVAPVSGICWWELGMGDNRALWGLNTSFCSPESTGAWEEAQSNQQNPVYCCWGTSGEEGNRDVGTSSNTQGPEEIPVKAATV